MGADGNARKADVFDDLDLRSKSLAVAAVPVNFLTVLAIWAATVAGDVLLAFTAGTGAVVTLGLAYRAASHLSRRIAEVTVAAEQLDPAKLRALCVAPRNPLATNRATTPAAEAGEAGGTDELSALLRTVEAVPVAISGLVAEHEAQQTSRVEALLGNIADRQRDLIDRQLERIDWLERTEPTPERLVLLFELDHLTTCAARSAEAVRVLGGRMAEGPADEPAPIETVLRAAIGQSNAYERIRLGAADRATVAGRPAPGLAHLVAELLNNAIAASPPEAGIELNGNARHGGGYCISIVDNGIGMSDEQLANANAALSEPSPLLEQTLYAPAGRGCGLTVVARLAKRLGATVQLAATPGSGVTATVMVPTRLLVENDGFDAGPARPVGHEVGHEITGELPAITDATRAVTAPERRVRRQRTSTSAPGPSSSERSTAEVRSVITRYRDGLTAAADTAPAGDLS